MEGAGNVVVLRARDATLGEMSAPPFCVRPQDERQVLGNGLWMAVCSDAAYQSPPEARKMLEGGGFCDVRFFDRCGTQGYVACHLNWGASICVLAFRGTEESTDLLSDVKCRKIEWTDGEWVHRGFAGAFRAIWAESDPEAPADDVWTNARAAVLETHSKYPEAKWVVTGHSLGGALAILAAGKMRADPALPTPATVYTIGCPRVGAPKFAKRLAEEVEIVRFVHESDAVPRVPPVLFRYRHVGGEYWFRKKKRDLWVTPKASASTRLEWLSHVIGIWHGLWMIPIGAVMLSALLVLLIDRTVGPMPFVAAMYLWLRLFAWLCLFLLGASWLLTSVVRELPLVHKLGLHALGDHGASHYVRTFRDRLAGAYGAEAA